MTENEILDIFKANLGEKLQRISVIMEKENLQVMDCNELKKIFHAIKGNLVSIHFNKNFVNEYGATLYTLLSSKETCTKDVLKKFIEEFTERVKTEL